MHFGVCRARCSSDWAQRRGPGPDVAGGRTHVPWAVPLQVSLKPRPSTHSVSHSPLLRACPSGSTRPRRRDGTGGASRAGRCTHPAPPEARHGRLCALPAGLYLEVRGALEGLPAHGADVDALTPVGCLAVLQQQAGRAKAAATLQARVQPGLLLRRSARGQAGGDVRHLQRGRIPTEPLRPDSQTTPDSRRRLLPTALTNLGCGIFFKKKDEKINQIVLTMQGRHTPCENDWPVTPVSGGHASTQERLCERRKKTTGTPVLSSPHKMHFSSFSKG